MLLILNWLSKSILIRLLLTVGTFSVVFPCWVSYVLYTSYVNILLSLKAYVLQTQQIYNNVYSILDYIFLLLRWTCLDSYFVQNERNRSLWFLFQMFMIFCKNHTKGLSFESVFSVSLQFFLFWPFLKPLFYAFLPKIDATSNTLDDSFQQKLDMCCIR